MQRHDLICADRINTLYLHFTRESFAPQGFPIIWHHERKYRVMVQSNTSLDTSRTLSVFAILVNGRSSGRSEQTCSCMRSVQWRGDRESHLRPFARTYFYEPRCSSKTLEASPLICERAMCGINRHTSAINPLLWLSRIAIAMRDNLTWQPTR